MTATPTASIADPQRINLSWLVKLRFSAILGQVITIVLVQRAMHVALPLLLLFSIIAVELFSNLLCVLYERSGRPLHRFMLPLIMGLDVLLLTGLLYLTGGPFNPFSFLYLVQIALAAVVLPPRWTWFLVALSLAGSAVLFMDHRPLPLLASSHEEGMSIHLRGMWVAFSVAASFIVYFLLRVTRALAQREAELAAAQKLAARQEKLASLATLAAGAAHELATPLSTIALVAGELERMLPAAPTQGEAGLAAALEDVRLIRRQVERCRGVLDQMAADAGESSGENIAPVGVGELLCEAAARAGGQVPVALTLDEQAAQCRVPLPRRALLQTLAGLLKNAQDATAAEGPAVVLWGAVTTSGDNARTGSPWPWLAGPADLSSGAAGLPGGLDARGPSLLIEVRDGGTGMPAAVLARAGEPFFTTKAPGQGMGLGLFLARAVVDRLGGELGLRSTPGEGTAVRISLPIRAVVDRGAVPAASATIRRNPGAA